MDLNCPTCGEPWDNDTFHEIAQEQGSTYQKVVREFQSKGCEALGESCGEPSQERDPRYGLTRQEAAGALYDLLGDDTDGAAAELADLGF